MPCIVQIPNFRHRLEAAGTPRLPALERLLARGRRLPDTSSAALLAPLFGLEATSFAPAPFMRLGDTGARDARWWMRADPVHLAPDRDQLLLLPGELLQAGRHETDALAEGFNDLYGAEGWRLEMGDTLRGYLRTPRRFDAVTHDPGPIAGQPVLESMPGGPDGAALRRLMNEVQMLFHTHPVNQAREEAGQPLINSLWLWGGGILPAFTGRAPAQVAASTPLLRGLALWAGREPGPLKDAAGLKPDSLVSLEAHDLQALERDWFVPLFDLLRAGKLDSLTLQLGGMGTFALTPAGARRFWRRRRAISDYLA